MQVRKEVVGDLGEQTEYFEESTGLSLIENDFFGPTVYLLKDEDVALAGIHANITSDGSAFISFDNIIEENGWEEWSATAERVVKTIRAYRAQKQKEQQ